MTIVVGNDGIQPTHLKKSQLFSVFQSQISCTSKTWQNIRTTKVLLCRQGMKAWDGIVKPLQCHNFYLCFKQLWAQLMTKNISIISKYILIS